MSRGAAGGDEGLKALAAVLPASNVTNLMLESSNSGGDEGLKALAPVLPDSKITNLRLDCCGCGSPKEDGVDDGNDINFGVEGFKALAAVLPYSNVTDLNFGRLWHPPHNPERVELTRLLMAVLPASKITNLALTRNGFGDEDVKALAAVLPASKVTNLSLLGNSFGDEVVNSLPMNIEEPIARFSPKPPPCVFQCKRPSGPLASWCVNCGKHVSEH